MLSHQPELVSNTSIAHRRPPWLARLSSFRFGQSISGQGQTNRKRELDRRIQKILLKRVDNKVFHFVIRTQLFCDRLFVCGEVQAAAAESLRAANENITRVMPLIIILTPTNVPIAHIELEGHCR